MSDIENILLNYSDKELGCVAPAAFEWTQKHTIHSVVVTDKDAVSSIKQYQRDHQQLVEPSCGAGLAVLYDHHLSKTLGELNEDDIVVFIVCGGNAVTMEMIQEWDIKLSK